MLAITLLLTVYTSVNSLLLGVGRTEGQANV